MGKVIDNSFTEDVNYVTANSLVRANRWASSVNGVKAFIDAIGISSDYNPRQSMVVSGAGDTLTCTPTAGHGSSAYWWVSVSDGKGHFAHGEVTDLATPGNVALDVSNFDYQTSWTVVIRARKTGDTQDAVVIWSIDNPSEDPTVAIPAGYHN